MRDEPNPFIDGVNYRIFRLKEHDGSLSHFSSQKLLEEAVKSYEQCKKCDCVFANGLALDDDEDCDCRCHDDDSDRRPILHVLKTIAFNGKLFEIVSERPLEFVDDPAGASCAKLVKNMTHEERKQLLLWLEKNVQR